ncbi:MAG TPA: hypothetical protein VJX67_08795 [Blastocatellia bacterium]|nr:hypothetical protein [Blastocatellia bacterium]
MSLSTDDPPVLTAVAAGHVTITAGTSPTSPAASTDVTVSAGPLSLGTVLWSNPGDGSGVQSIVPAVPSPTGVADVFAFQNDGTVAAITSDGKTAWTANVSQLRISPLPDFLGGLAGIKVNSDYTNSLIRYDGMTGQQSIVYTTSSSLSTITNNFTVHPDGTILAIQGNNSDTGPLPSTVIGIDPSSGGQKFSVPIPQGQPNEQAIFGMIIAGDGYAYIPYTNLDRPYGSEIVHLRLFRVNSSGASDDIPVMDWTNAITDLIPPYKVGIITNADQGVLMTWQTPDGPYMAVTTGTSVSVMSGPSVPGQANAVVPVLQAQDGSFVGSLTDPSTGATKMVAFDQSGIRYIVPNEQPQIATEDGGVVGKSGIAYDLNGDAAGQIGQLIQSWTFNTYQIGSVESVIKPIVPPAMSLLAQFQAPFLLPPYLAPFAEAESYLPAILSTAEHALQSKSACAALFGNSNSRQGAFSPPTVFNTLYGNIGIQGLPFAPNQVDGTRVSTGFAYGWFNPLLAFKDALTVRALYISTSPPSLKLGVRVCGGPLG